MNPTIKKVGSIKIQRKQLLKMSLKQYLYVPNGIYYKDNCKRCNSLFSSFIVDNHISIVIDI